MPHAERPSKGEISLYSYNFLMSGNKLIPGLKKPDVVALIPSIQEAEADKSSVSYKPAWST